MVSVPIRSDQSVVHHVHKYDRVGFNMMQLLNSKKNCLFKFDLTKDTLMKSIKVTLCDGILHKFDNLNKKDGIKILLF